MWVLVFIYFYDAQPYVELVSGHKHMTDCFMAREELANELGKGNGFFKAEQQGVCINMLDS